MKKQFFVYPLFIALILMGCSAETASTVSNPQGISVSDPWGRASPSAANNGAFFMQLKNAGKTDQRLIGADSPACEVAELHQMTMDEGVMKMSPVAGGEILLPTGETVMLESGGLHVMCIGKLQEFAPDAQLELTLHFADAEDIVVSAEIRDIMADNK